jgi:hypothetical protein
MHARPPGPGNPDQQKDEALVGGGPLPSDRSLLPRMEGAEKLWAPLREVSAHPDELGLNECSAFSLFSASG